MKIQRAASPFRWRMPARRALVAILFSYAFLPLGAATGLVKFAWGPRAYAPSPTTNLIAYFVMTLVFVQCVLVWPLSADKNQLRANPARLLVRLALMIGALASLCYYLGYFIVAEQGIDAALGLIPSAVIFLFCYERTSAKKLSLLLTLGLFASLFLLGDVLGPLPTYFRYASLGPSLYNFRALFAVIAILYAWFMIPGWEPKRFSKSLKLFRTGSVLLFLSGAIIWTLDARLEGHVGDTFWLGYAVYVYFLFRPGHFSERALWALGAAHTLALLSFIVVEWADASVGMWSQLGLIQKIFAAAYSLCLVVRLSRERTFNRENANLTRQNLPA